MVAQLPRGHPDLNEPAEPEPAAEPAEQWSPARAFGAVDPCGVGEPQGVPPLAELRSIAAAALARMAELRERDRPVPEALFHAAERLQPLLDGVDPEGPDELDELWSLALALPRSGPVQESLPDPARPPRPPAALSDRPGTAPYEGDLPPCG